MTTSAPDSPPTTPRHQPARTGLIVFGILMIAAALGSAAIVPYMFALQGRAVPDLPLWSWLLAIVPNLVLIAPLTALGLWLGPRVGLGAPLLSAWIEGRPDATRACLRRLPLAAGIGAAVGVVLLVGAAAFLPWLPEELGQTPAPSWWQALLASVSAGITEELMLRLGLMTILVWLGTKLARRREPSPAIVWAAIASPRWSSGSRTCLSRPAWRR